MKSYPPNLLKGMMMRKQSIAPQDAQAERAKRELARRHFLPFCKYVDKRYPDAKHLEYLTEKLEQVYEYIASGGQRGIGRLMIFMPPRYWKSSTASQKFPAWVIGKAKREKKPDVRVMLASYGADLAGEHSGKVRDIIDGMQYQALFGVNSTLELPVEVSEEKHKATNWKLADGDSGMMSAGVDGAFVGKGGHLLIMDDPFKNRAEAESEARRKQVMKFYQSSFYMRQEDGAAIILIMTRWDQEDICGQLLAAMVSDEDADQWEVVSMPAIARDEKDYPKTEQEFRDNLLRGVFLPMDGDQLGRNGGEALWSEKHTVQQLKKIQTNVGDFEFVSQFLQSPRLESGGFFDDDDFKIVDRAPEGLIWYCYLDLALGETQTSDLNAAAFVALYGEDLYIRDVFDERELEKFLAEVRSLMLSDRERFTRWGVEDVAFQLLVFKDFQKDPGLVNTEIAAVAPRGDKVERARPWRRRAKNKRVFLVRNPWNRGFIRNTTSFPKGKNDHVVDSVSGGVQMIAEDAGGGSSGKTVSSKPTVTNVAALFQGA